MAIDYREGLSVVCHNGVDDPFYGTIVRVNKKSFRVRDHEGVERTLPKDWVTYYDDTPTEPVPYTTYGVVFKLVDNSTEFVNLGSHPLTVEQISDTVHKIINNPQPFFVVGKFAIRKDMIAHDRVYIKK